MSRPPLGRRLGVLVLSLAASAAIATPAQAALTSHSGADTNATNGFPTWYEDDAGLRLQQCVDGTPQCILVPGELAGVPGDPEIFWWAAETALTDGTRAAELVLALEGAQDAPPAVNFGRYQILMDGFTPNATYTVTTPYDTRTFTMDAGGNMPRFRDEIGCDAAPCDFDAALASHIGPFLRWDPAVAPAAPAGYIGDPATPHEIVGSPTGNNVFRIEGPNAGGPGVDVWETRLFTVMGKVEDGANANGATGADTWSPGALTFDGRTVGTTSASQPIAIKNTGLASLAVAAPQITGPGAADYTTVNGCPTAPRDPRRVELERGDLLDRRDLHAARGGSAERDADVHERRRERRRQPGDRQHAQHRAVRYRDRPARSGGPAAAGSGEPAADRGRAAGAAPEAQPHRRPVGAEPAERQGPRPDAAARDGERAAGARPHPPRRPDRVLQDGPRGEPHPHRRPGPAAPDAARPVPGPAHPDRRLGPAGRDDHPPAAHQPVGAGRGGRGRSPSAVT